MWLLQKQKYPTQVCYFHFSSSWGSSVLICKHKKLSAYINKRMTLNLVWCRHTYLTQETGIDIECSGGYQKINSTPIDSNKLFPWREKQALQVLLLKIQAGFMNWLLQSSGWFGTFLGINMNINILREIFLFLWTLIWSMCKNSKKDKSKHIHKLFYCHYICLFLYVT